ncbi:MAG: ABC transporter ATP-binding protein [Spirochaetales bacterium]|nr:ABC transporter ATP-binding protein [Candidatus Physcosoma equi]
MAETIVEFKDFTWKYDAQAEPTLNGINLKIHKGEKVLICGPSGCGKSTIAHTLNGLIPASYPGTSTGSLTIKGKDYQDLDIFQLSKITGTVLQDSDGQFIGLTVGEDIAFALENDNVPVEELRRRVLETARKVDIEDFLHHAPHELSGGQKQRVSLAGVMVDDVDLYLFDEPLANLDPASGKKTIELIDEIHKNTGSAVVIIEHRLEDVLHRPVDRIVLMLDGRIVADMTPDELLSSQLLFENGIREPLYVTALKYAGVHVTPDMKPGQMKTLLLSEEQKEKVRSWYYSLPEKTKGDDTESILETKDLSFAYSNGHVALKGIDFSVKKGEMMAIVGRNGAGKSTVSTVICGFEHQTEGKVFFEGRDLEGDSIKERASHIAYVMQNPNQMITKPMIREEVSLGLQMEGKLSEEEIRERVDYILDVCGLKPFRSWPVSALSFGQKKRVTIASILSMEPDVIILDEPTAGQDLRHYTEFMEFLKALHEKGVTVIFITHDMHLMLEYCERAAVFADGRKIADMPCEEILTDETITEKASLKKTSLSELAVLCGLPETGFVRRFISVDRGERK